MEKADFGFWSSHDLCKRDRYGSIQARCPLRKRDEIIAKRIEYENNRNIAARAMKRHMIKSNVKKREEVLNTEDF